MAKYLIHACPQRMWYVNEYLIPSMHNQGIQNIDVICDEKGLGNLESFMQCFIALDGDDGIWHLNDDILIGRNFSKMTQEHDDGIVCGFSCWPTTPSGYVKATEMWWSFPCIRIPNRIARECAEWFYSYAQTAFEYQQHVATKMEDDWFFKEFLSIKYPEMIILQLEPSIVDHVDYLIGGSVLMGWKIPHRAKFFNDKDLVKELELQLNKRKEEQKHD